MDQEAAQAASARADWPTAVSLWRKIYEQDRAAAEPALQLGRALREFQRFDEADVVLAPLLPDHQDAAIEYAWSAQQRDDWEEAIRRWDALRASFPAHPISYAAGCSALVRLGRFDDADALIVAGMDVAPDPILPIHHAWTATVARNWDEAVRRWRVVTAADPGDVTAFVCLGEALIALRRFDEWDREVRPVADRTPDRPELRQQYGRVRGSSREGTAALRATGMLCAQFESIGEGREFALVQRHFGAEPVSLLRWTGIKLPDLVRGLDRRFAGLGETIEFRPDAPEYSFQDTLYGIEFHTFVPVDRIPAPVFAEILRARLRTLVERFLADIAGATRVFVHTPRNGTVAPSEVATLARALRRFGDARLLCVVCDATRHDAGIFEEIGPNLGMGYLAKMSAGGRHDEIAYLSWKRLLEQAARHWALPA